MNEKIKKGIFFVLAASASAALSFYAFSAAVFYAWRNASGSWSAEKAALWTYGALALFAGFFALSIYFIVKLIALRKSQGAT